jgi:hypothetical protein
LDREELFHKTLTYLCESGTPLTIGELAAALPPTHDLETLAYWLARTRQAGIAIDGRLDPIELVDESHQHTRFQVPSLHISLLWPERGTTAWLQDRVLRVILPGSLRAEFSTAIFAEDSGQGYSSICWWYSRQIWCWPNGIMNRKVARANQPKKGLSERRLALIRERESIARSKQPSRACGNCNGRRINS